MLYKEVNFFTGSESGKYNTLLIDGNRWYFDLYEESNCTVLESANGSYSNYIRYKIDILLELDRLNPKETLDTFFKLLILA
jgi:hypothetical protein